MPYVEPSEEAFFAADRRVVELSDRMVAIWDGKQSRGLGGTADVVAYAADRRVHTDIVWPSGLVR